ncbi:MAG: hypothetical protein ACI8ZN_002617 [Bacteroidia bacterium]
MKKIIYFEGANIHIFKIIIMKATHIIVILGLASMLFAACTQSTSTNVDPSLATNNKTASDPEAQNPEPQMTFEETVFDFGRITEGEHMKHTFRFTNTGNESLVISDCKASCGCTTPKCAKGKPIAPGDKGEIEVVFNSQGKPKNQSKTITITANTAPPQNMLTIKGYVIPTEEEK